MSDERPTLDDDVRVTVATDLARTLFVEAGAGSGKTTVLVSRVCALVESGVDLTKIAAITFTEKAAAELRVRVREELRRRPPSPLIERALASLGDAPMSTLHSFAHRISPSTVWQSECRRDSSCSTRWARRSTSRTSGGTLPPVCSTLTAS